MITYVINGYRIIALYPTGATFEGETERIILAERLLNADEKERNVNPGYVIARTLGDTPVTWGFNTDEYDSNRRHARLKFQGAINRHDSRS